MRIFKKGRGSEFGAVEVHCKLGTILHCNLETKQKKKLICTSKVVTVPNNLSSVSDLCLQGKGHEFYLSGREICINNFRMHNRLDEGFFFNIKYF